MKSFRIKNVLAAMLIAVFGLLSTSNAFAEESGISGIQISPTTDRMQLDPGAEYSNNLTITNTGDHTINYVIEITPYQVSGLDYAPVYDVENAHTQVSKWITVDKTEGTIDPNHIDIVHYTINVPEDAPGGSQYAAIFIKTGDTNTENQNVRVIAGTGLVITAQVSGDTRMTGSISETEIPGFLLAPPLTVSSKFKNTGNVDGNAVMTLKVENYFTGAMIYDNTGDPLTKTILPETERQVNLVANNLPRLGVVKAHLSNEFMGEAEVKTRIVIICPLWFIAIILLIILTIVARIITKRRDDRRTRSYSRNSQGSADKFNL